ncbi:hypothetical protein, partial [Dankookia rubra]|uniref:hypothetical protein n=1 Tax=Dankookia rubra TaxID=1442381 RepID=UPI0019D54A0C
LAPDTCFWQPPRDAGAWKVRPSLPHPSILRAFQQPARTDGGRARTLGRLNPPWKKTRLAKLAGLMR